MSKKVSRKPSQNYQHRPILGLPEAAAYLLNLVAFGYITLPFIVIHPSFAEPYDIIFRFGILVAFSITVAATLVVLRGQASKRLLRTLRFFAGLTAVVLLVLLSGVLQDIVGARCPGFFGTTQSCVDSRIFTVFVALTSPPVFISLALAFNTAFIIGLCQSFRKP